MNFSESASMLAKTGAAQWKLLFDLWKACNNNPYVAWRSSDDPDSTAMYFKTLDADSLSIRELLNVALLNMKTHNTVAYDLVSFDGTYALGMNPPHLDVFTQLLPRREQFAYSVRKLSNFRIQLQAALQRLLCTEKKENTQLSTPPPPTHPPTHHPLGAAHIAGKVIVPTCCQCLIFPVA
jgi:hypothetical protein